MMRYNCTVKLHAPNGAPCVQDAPRENVSAAEILVLRTLHGNDAVTGIVGIKNDKSSHEEERARLHQRYGRALQTAGRSIGALFGEYGKLPVKLPDHDKLEAAEDDEPEAEDEAA